MDARAAAERAAEKWTDPNGRGSLEDIILAEFAPLLAAKDAEIVSLAGHVETLQSRSISCCFCNQPCASLKNLREHSAACPSHPAVADRDRLAAEVERLRQLEGTTDHPEHRCEKCGGRNITWYADSDIWNRYSGDASILCPLCFARAAEAGGIEVCAWRLAPGDHSDEAGRLMVRMHDAEERAYVLAAEVAELRAQVEAHENCDRDVQRLTRELDVALSGEDGAAKQASLCDLIHPAEALRRDAERYAFVREHLAHSEGAFEEISPLWSFRHLPGRHSTFDAAIDAAIAAQKTDTPVGGESPWSGQPGDGF